MIRNVAAVMAVALFTASPAAAQDARETIAHKTRKGDRVTVTTYEHGVIQGRVVTAGAEILTIETAAGPATIPYSAIDRVKRRRNGVLLGTLIGLGTGIALGIPAKMLADNETGDGTAALITIAAIGAGVGMGIDAAVSTSRTIYWRPAATVGFQLAPLPRGAAAGVSVGW